MIVSIIGWIGTLAYTLYGVPQIILCLKNGKAGSISRLFAATYLCGCLLSLSYALYRHDAVLSVNFMVGVISWLIINKYIYFPRKD